VEQRESLSLAFLTLLETLTPPERAVFLLREVFDYSYDEIAAMLDKTPASCRQLLHRAQTRLATGRHRFTASPDEQRALLQRFLRASQEGDVETLAAALAQDVTVWSDGGGKVPAPIRPIMGVQATVRLLTSLARKVDTQPEPVTITSEEINGSPALMVWIGEKLDVAISLALVSGHIGDIYVVRNPDKLAYLQRQLRQRHTPAT
ncbi:MAG TPA: sigma factor-like helix-turn-helix DNA-binding protein, partial [Ktedonobacterales bacterium]